LNGTQLFINYDSPSALRAFLKEHDLGMQKKFSQNFLINADARKRLVDALAVAPGDTVWEVGPGLGAMTSLLLKQGAELRVFEIDRGFCGVLKNIFSLQKNFTLIEGDVLKTWKLHKKAEQNISLLGNLPYHIGAKLLGDFVEHNFFFKRIVITVQKEVAARIASKAGCKNYSSLSALLSYYYDITLLPVLKAENFFPAPNVESQSVRLELKKSCSQDNNALCFARLIRALFSSRRKTVKNNLSAYIKANNIPCDASVILDECTIAPQSRAEQLAPEDFMRITTVLAGALRRTVGS
jgi:16S rRNA (adenine1518-N6/adenine1519-N6)-dimethyltransferase